MKCPIMGWVSEVPYNRYESGVNDCLVADCAWWVDATGSCAIQQLPLVMSGLADIVEQLVEKMPREEQFRK